MIAQLTGENRADDGAHKRNGDSQSQARVRQAEDLRQLLLGAGNYGGIETKQQPAQGADDGASEHIGIYAAHRDLQSLAGVAIGRIAESSNIPLLLQQQCVRHERRIALAVAAHSLHTASSLPFGSAK